MFSFLDNRHRLRSGGLEGWLGVRIHIGQGGSSRAAVFNHASARDIYSSGLCSCRAETWTITEARERLCLWDVDCSHTLSRCQDVPSSHRRSQHSTSSGEPGHDGVQNRRIIRLSGNVLVSSFVRDTLKYRMASVRRRLTRSRPYFVPHPIAAPPSAPSLAVLRPLLLWNVDFGDLTRILVAASFARSPPAHYYCLDLIVNL